MVCLCVWGHKGITSADLHPSSTLTVLRSWTSRRDTTGGRSLQNINLITQKGVLGKGNTLLLVRSCHSDKVWSNFSLSIRLCQLLWLTYQLFPRKNKKPPKQQQTQPTKTERRYSCYIPTEPGFLDSEPYEHFKNSGWYAIYKYIFLCPITISYIPSFKGCTAVCLQENYLLQIRRASLNSVISKAGGVQSDNYLSY